MASHPIVGAWLIAPRPVTGATSGYGTIVFGANGSVLQGWPASAPGPQGVTFSGPGVGIWAPIDEHTIDFTAVTAFSSATICDKGGAVIAKISDSTASHVTATRIRHKAPGCPAETPTVGTLTT